MNIYDEIVEGKRRIDKLRRREKWLTVLLASYLCVAAVTIFFIYGLGIARIVPVPQYSSTTAGEYIPTDNAGLTAFVKAVMKN